LMILFQEGGLEEHAAAAIRAALAIREKTRAANREAEEGRPAIAVNIGISSGEGDVGATRFQGSAGERWTFTATGPVTNLAARLGDLSEHGQILLSPQTAARVRGRFRMRSCHDGLARGAFGRVTVRGAHDQIEPPGNLRVAKTVKDILSFLSHRRSPLHGATGATAERYRAREIAIGLPESIPSL
jgi:class 3 adenylate cyclase